jgi:hypothetical protein
MEAIEMAEYQVTCVVKPNGYSPHEHITYLGGPDGDGWTLTTAQVIARIMQHGDVFYTRDGHKRANIEVKENPYTRLPFVQTPADRDSKNNLLNLETCPPR